MVPFIRIIALTLSLMLLNGCYLLKQGSYLLRYQMRARNINRMLKRDDISEELKEFLYRVKDIRTFAIDSLGLRNNNNYCNYVQTDRKYMVDVVAGAREDSFEMYRWWFPFFGRFPYKGFFVREDALKEAARLKNRGYDVSVARAMAFSTLGFFSDPVYSFMKEFTAYELAVLIIHEQMHATVWLKEQIQFNEEIATFAGNQGGLQYVKMLYGKDSPEYTEAILSQKDYDTYIDLVRDLFKMLDSLYSSEIEREDKLAKKELVIDGFKERIGSDYDLLFRTDQYRGLAMAAINNAFIASRMTYTLDLSLLYELYEKEGNDLAAVILKIKQVKKYRGDDPKDFIEELLTEGDP